MSDFWDRAERDRDAGEIRDGDTRYLLFRVDVIAALIAGLDDRSKAQALTAFCEAVHDNGGHSLKRYLTMVGGDIDALLDTVIRTAGDLGWGAWSLDRSIDTLVLDVRNSPFAEIETLAGAPVCAPIQGMFQALGETVFGVPVTVAETRCAALGEPLCTFHATRGEPSLT